ncbi:RNA methyltransferase tRNA(m5U54)methyltransferase [Arthrobotrys musiformis]|uniref:tRNA (guanine(26)-N(2))-dimethyltransferase n=1 Tax=Arthrobotrys musiformis TaxID=47236 RepID=A0AAV9W2I0_9PEZI
MARRKARGARRVHTDTNVDIPLPDAPTTSTSSEPPPPNGQAQAKLEAEAQAQSKHQNQQSKKRKSPPPPELETTVIEGITYKIQPEGLAKILLPPVGEGNTTEVFYNYIQKFNRDLTMVVTRGFGEVFEAERRSKAMGRRHRGGAKHKKIKEVVVLDGEEGKVNGVDLPAEDVDMAEPTPEDQPNDIKEDANEEEKKEGKPRFAVLDALSATGLRALRYAKELPFVTHVTANDMSPTAVEYIYRNIQFNNLTHIITPNHDNAVGHMYRTAFPAYIPSPTPTNPYKTKLVAAEKYHVIDLDPYGSATQFIDSALQALEDGGLLSVTCTDAAIFASTSYPEKTFATYGGLPAKGDYSHETGLRMVLMSIATTAAKYGLYIEPLLSLSIDYYCRVFVRARKGAENVKKLSGKGMMVVTCDSGCGAWKVQELGTLRVRQNDKVAGKGNNPSYKYGVSQAVESGRCDHCGFKMHIAGPMWADEIHDAGFINHILSNVLGGETVGGYETLGRVTGMLKLALGELMPPSPPPTVPTESVGVQTTETANEDATRPSLKRKLKNREDAAAKDTQTDSDHKRPKRNPTSDPLSLFIMPTQLSRVIHCTAPSLAAFRGALMGLGYHVTKSHCRAGSVKTNAPWDQIWRVMRAWEKLHPVKAGSVTPGMAGYGILYPTEPADDLEVVEFDEVLGKDREKGKGEVLYQQNPGAYWGPMARASKKGLTAEESSKLGNAEKDKRRREERARREAERTEEGGEGQKAKRKKGDGEEIHPGKGGSRESDGAQYGLAAISASEMERLEKETMKA